jgi:hypothetical protein
MIRIVDTEPDWPYIDAVLNAHRVRLDLQGWTYTHGWRELDADYMNDVPSLCWNASCDTADEAVEALKAGWPTTVVVGKGYEGGFLEDGTRVVVCPFETHGITCSDCMLCFRKKRSCVVGFPVHGKGAKHFTADDRLRLPISLCGDEARLLPQAPAGG